MFRAPQKTELTIKFEAENLDRKEELHTKRMDALRMISKKDYTAMQDFNALALKYNEDLVSFGGQSGFGFSLLNEKSIF